MNFDLIMFLARLDSEGEENGLFVNPDDFDDFLIRDCKSFIGSPENKGYYFVGKLSQVGQRWGSFEDNLYDYLRLEVLVWKGDVVDLCATDILQAWKYLDEDFTKYVTETINSYISDDSWNEAEYFVRIELSDRMTLSNTQVTT